MRNNSKKTRYRLSHDNFFHPVLNKKKSRQPQESLQCNLIKINVMLKHFYCHVSDLIFIAIGIAIPLNYMQ